MNQINKKIMFFLEMITDLYRSYGVYGSSLLGFRLKDPIYASLLTQRAQVSVRSNEPPWFLPEIFVSPPHQKKASRREPALSFLLSMTSVIVQGRGKHSAAPDKNL